MKEGPLRKHEGLSRFLHPVLAVCRFRDVNSHPGAYIFTRPAEPDTSRRGFGGGGGYSETYRSTTFRSIAYITLCVGANVVLLRYGCVKVIPYCILRWYCVGYQHVGMKVPKYCFVYKSPTRTQ